MILYEALCGDTCVNSLNQENCVRFNMIINNEVMDVRSGKESLGAYVVFEIINI